MNPRARDVTPRDKHPGPPERALDRIKYVVDLMSDGRWERGGTAYELAEDWKISVNTAEYYSKCAHIHLELIKDRELVLQKVAVKADRWLDEDGRDRVQCAELLVKTVGGFTQKQQIEHSISQNPSQLVSDCLAFIEEHPEHHARLLEAAERIKGRMLGDGAQK